MLHKKYFVLDKVFFHFNYNKKKEEDKLAYSTVTLFAKFLG
jgi:hypothetical protein